MEKVVYSDGRFYWIMTKHGAVEISGAESDRLIFEKQWNGCKAKLVDELDPLEDL